MKATSSISLETETWEDIDALKSVVGTNFRNAVIEEAVADFKKKHSKERAKKAVKAEVQK